jgi:low affinity Fe/Cu permease
MSAFMSGRPSHLVYALLAVILFGGYGLFNGFQNENSATMTPTLTLNR